MTSSKISPSESLLTADSPAPAHASRGALLVFAHRDEAQAFADLPHLVTGVGKASASGALGHALARGRRVAALASADPVLAAVGAYREGGSAGDRDAPENRERDRAEDVIDRVIVLGTAGVVSDGADAPTLGGVVQITAALQHDFSLPSAVLDVPGVIIVDPGSTAVIATGDQFITNDADRQRIAELGAGLVDMETYAYVDVCRRFGVPLQVFKVPSDFADSSTTDQDWDDIAAEKSRQLREFWNQHFA